MLPRFHIGQPTKRLTQEMTYSHLLLLLSTLCLSACGINSPLTRASEICVKYPTPETRGNCEKRQKEVSTEIEKSLDDHRKREKVLQQDDLPSKNDLCFKRQSTGEMVCPN
jgi:hypothetical protein